MRRQIVDKKKSKRSKLDAAKPCRAIRLTLKALLKSSYFVDQNFVYLNIKALHRAIISAALVMRDGDVV